jgi:septal ring factor EnvC (AmiA/AmiB activator)
MTFDPHDDDQMDPLAKMGTKLAEQADRISDLEQQLHQANMEWGEAERLRRASDSRASALEAALRKVDEIRHELKGEAMDGDRADVNVLVAALKAPCMEVWK